MGVASRDVSARRLAEERAPGQARARARARAAPGAIPKQGPRARALLAERARRDLAQAVASRPRRGFNRRRAPERSPLNGGAAVPAHLPARGPLRPRSRSAAGPDPSE